MQSTRCMRRTEVTARRRHYRIDGFIRWWSTARITCSFKSRILTEVWTLQPNRADSSHPRFGSQYFYQINPTAVVNMISATAHLLYTGWRNKNGATGHPISLQLIFRKLHDWIAWKLVNFCNIICWTQSLTFCLNISSLLSFIHTVWIDLSITQ